ncbi:MAG TPA: alpha-glucuronidase family glycosyl hydrolase [Gemmatimonadaceae bacterium]|nr:alpha-glucuronidase family glycosyl hydrolase [Gemmatimonadaceae bacterium]
MRLRLATAARRACLACLLLACAGTSLRADDGYDLWLRFAPVRDAARLAQYRAALTHLVIEGDSPSLAVAREELVAGMRGLLDRDIPLEARPLRAGAVIAGTRASSPLIAALPLAAELRAVGREGYVIRRMAVKGRSAVVIAANSDIGAVYGVYAFLRQLQTQRPLDRLAVASAPRVQLRMLDHWDNLDGSVERGYAGSSLWEWTQLPATVSPRYRDYARANAAVGINGTLLTSVSTNARALTPEYLRKAAALADVFRPYGIRVFLTARFSAPIEIGGLTTADPLDPVVRQWWRHKTDEVYAVIPDFGGFLVQGDAEGQPGPEEYGRTHADGANLLADAIVSHGGIVIWRAYMSGDRTPPDRVREIFDEFIPLDGNFRRNVMVQVKNGPLDFQPREPFNPMLGAMPRTPLLLEMQVTKEYLGNDSHLVYLGALFEEVLRADTHRRGRGSTVARVVDGSLHGATRSGIAGVANIGTDRNWTGSIFNQANWYAFGRMAWDPSLSSRGVAEEWVRITFSNDSTVVATVRGMMMSSREAVVNYMTPLGLAGLTAAANHYGPAPWIKDGRPDWTPVYFHRADVAGLGFDRTREGSDALEQYAEPVRARYANRATVPDSLLLWFHHVGWRERLGTGRTLWEELAQRYNAGVDTVRAMQRAWNSVEGRIDDERFRQVQASLGIQEREARWWRDASLQYFQTLSRLPIPAQFERPARPLDFYMRLRCPADPRRPRCDAVR